MRNAVKAVIFDFGQTLVDSADGFRQAEKEAQEKLFAGLALSLRDPFLENYRRIRSQFHGRSEFSRRAMWRELYHYYCLAADDRQLTAWETEYWETVKAHSTLFPEAVPVLERLNRRVRVALITNTQGQPRSGTHRISQFPQLEPYFQVVIVAGEDGVPPKPDPEPFRRCLAELGVARGRGRVRRGRLAHRRGRLAGCRAQARVAEARAGAAQLAGGHAGCAGDHEAGSAIRAGGVEGVIRGSGCPWTRLPGNGAPRILPGQRANGPAAAPLGSRRPP